MRLAVRRLEWDSEFFGFSIGEGHPATLDDVAAVDGWAADERLRCVYICVPAENFALMHAAESLGFHLMGVHVTSDICAPFATAAEADHVVVRPARPTDVAALERIAGGAHPDTRFYADPGFSRESCRRLYETWIRRSTEGWADCVLVAIGAVPETEWLAGSGLSLGNGVECDSYLRAAPGVYAAGDVASWPSPRYQRRVRIEHRMNATEMGNCAARNLLSEAAAGDLEAFDPLPYFWSDQYKVKLQVHGDLSPECTATIEEGSIEDGKFVALFRRDGVVSAVLGWSAAAKMPGYRKLLLG